jgi:hypothetical protein
VAKESDGLWALVLTVMKFRVKKGGVGGGNGLSDRLCAVEFGS